VDSRFRGNDSNSHRESELGTDLPDAILIPCLKFAFIIPVRLTFFGRIPDSGQSHDPDEGGTH
jgi:hypothetical protein